MTANTLSITDFDPLDMSGLESGSIFSKLMTREKQIEKVDDISHRRQQTAANISMDMSTTSLLDEQSIDEKLYKDRSLKSILNKLNEMYVVGDNWHEDALNGPDINTIEFSTILTYQFIENDFFPTVVTQTVEEGICFVFKNKQKYFYLEIYNDGEAGIIVEDYNSKIIISNKSVSTTNDIISEVSQFLYK
ncbi:MAG: hypothetical protein HQ510_09420 [Candidatus Marinimicrobia bacterium]|nr:hypothetical protein [Candidatus Neomarinimicrobiota bacterium]